MSTETSALPASANTQSIPRWMSWLLVAALVYLLLAAVGAIGSGFKAAAGEDAKTLFEFASNPVIALIIGVVATALIQSSSTVTSIIVGMVAGGLPVAIAIPMVMGANIGTSLTSTLVSLGHVRNGEEFRRAFSAATVHDSFNLLAVAIVLPLELLFQPLARASEWLAGLLVSDTSMSLGNLNFMKAMLAPATGMMKDSVAWLPGIWSGVALILLGIGLILMVVTQIGRVLRTLMEGRAMGILRTAVGRGPVSGMASGTLVTVLVQSSSTTTSLIVPLAGSGMFSLKQVYPFILGSNIGTTITALLAATAITGASAMVALQIALVHLLFNLLAIALIYLLPMLRSLPLYMAEGLAGLAQRNKGYVAAYIGGVFFALPLGLVGLSQWL
ncbi:Na/Pi symporter [Oceanimonas pelagia]|uniref:Na/Pi symporter n=1 Tax=Oceanimonas pelagia TaxID=3028314 RepID=A0AA50QAR7_9GAMM|nr:Na/Pi symporter [Oceanimonas pelagia]WMC09326.1 Na/Pi symporter [Oceanimonas pelagia]